MAKARRAASSAAKESRKAGARAGPRLSPGAWLGLGFALVLAAYHALFGGFFPNVHGNVGSDYSGEATYRVAGYFWAHVNGPVAVPWFTPAFCGGLPYFGDPQTSYYSVPQLFAAFVDPIVASYLTMLAFAAAGFFGMWSLLRAVFRAGRTASFLGAALFLCNGFFAHRMIMGHVIFHGFMLLPALLFVLLRPLPEAHRARAIIRDALFAGLIVGYCVQAGMASMIAPAALAALAVACLFAALGGDLRPMLWRGIPGALLAGGMSAAKLAAATAFLSHFDRSGYTLPQTGSLFDSLRLAFEALFLSPADIADTAASLLVRKQWRVDRWEWEEGVTLVPLVLLVAATALWIRGPRSASRWTPPRLAAALGLLGILILPIALNTYSPGWFAILKLIPLVKSTSVLFRWFVIYIPIVIVAAAVALDRMPLSPRLRDGLALAGVAAMLVINFAADRTSYQREPYSPAAINNAFAQVKRGELTPHITGIDATLDEQNHISLPLERNDSMARSLSQAACYNPIFGYRLETFPFKTLHPGPALEEQGGVLNVKNPACYLFPEENDCAPGDHFRGNEREAAESFLAYKPFSFQFSARQRLANAITEISLLLIAATCLWLALPWLRKVVVRAND